MSATDWQKDFETNGFVVIPSVIPPDKAAEYQTRAFDWLQSFGNHTLDLDDSSTWTQENLPFISEINTFNYYGVVHEQFMWDIRLEPGVVDVFSKVWGTDKLIVSFDALNITLPRRPGHVPRQKWPHVDQSPYRDGLQCVQGIVNLSKAGPEDGGLTVYPGSHKLTEAFFQEHTDKSQWSRKDFFRYTPDQISWFEKQGYKEFKVIAEPGDLIIWDSRLIHFGAEPTGKSNRIRTVTYVSYAPASFATEEALKAKNEAFKNWLATTHWPHDNIVLRTNHPTLPDGTVDKSRSEPIEKPELTEKLLKLAGIKAY
ncbi:phytanoyl-CoA dioxygenase [Colletotrichum truncatum]|uniref:Phytanoyl-CoA dioxygenase n=1 Tax=Colletotrichum truncatum TaxID=5467 RepID=A0ACC3Z390_COLTU|nr:phytanoyl-CoA dioxygenase [Colletotrichum truncatum]KAF6793145.1 phytanoyl-CoA dioxygenase [Colletotrichum truncatum]